MQTLRRTNSKYEFICAITLTSLLLLSACSKQETEIKDYSPVLGAANTVNMAQGWSVETQDAAWFTSFGSRLIPYQWLLNLELPDSQQLFRSDQHMQSLGFLTQGPSPLNPGGLPVGFTREEDSKGLAWAGLGCAACHTGEIKFNNNKIRIDGGQGMLDFNRFEASVIDSLSATIADQAKFDRFSEAVLSGNQDALGLKTQMVTLTEQLSTRHRINRTEVAYGNGRLDAFGQIFNAASVQFLGIGENRHEPNAPVSYPFLWSAAHLDVVQWNGSAPNANSGPLFQNSTTALAVYGNIEIHGHSGKAGYPSTINFNNLAKIQEFMYHLKSPLWPEKILGALDQQQVKRGKALYAQECISCHQISNRDEADRKLKATLTSLDEIGTDPTMVTNFLNATVKSGPLEGQKVAMLAGDTMGAETTAINVVAHLAIGSVMRHPLKAVRAAIVDYHSVYDHSLDQHPDYYKARPLDGIWATPPYLHNGSVSSLHELLLPAEQRLEQFYVGLHEYDPKKVGLDTKQADNSTLLDTRLKGNAKTGHEYGTTLSAQQKTDLVEYLKSL